MQLERAKFADNGGCGYVLKPPYLRSRQPTAAPAAPDTDTSDAVSGAAAAAAAAAAAPPPPLPPPASGPSDGWSVPDQLRLLRVEILGALHIPCPGEARGNSDAFHFAWWPTLLQPAATVCDPFISIEAFGGAFAGAATRHEEAQHRQAWCSTAEARNGLNPRWGGSPPGSEHLGGRGEVGEVVISHPEISQLYISVCYKTKDGKGKTKQLGAAALPIAAVREGVRCVSLVDEHGNSKYAPGKYSRRPYSLHPLREGAPCSATRRTSDCLLLSTYYLLPTTNNLLPTAYLPGAPLLFCKVLLRVSFDTIDTKRVKVPATTHYGHTMTRCDSLWPHHDS